MSGRCQLTAALIFVAVLTSSDAKRVVLYPVPFASYIIYHGNIASSLASLGHEVWICVPHFLLNQNLVKDKSVHILEYGENLGDITSELFESNQLVDNFWAGKNTGGISLLFNMYFKYRSLCVNILSDKSFVEKVKNVKADLFVLDSMPFHLNMIVLPYLFDIPYALIGTLHDVIMARVPFSPGATPSPGEAMSDRMSFLQRFKSTISSVVAMAFEIYYDSSLVSRFAPDKPYVSIRDLAARAEVFIAELDHVLDYPRPMLPNTKLIGGSSAGPPTPLVGEFKKFVEESKYGIIVASFGGAVIDVPPYITSKMLSAFKQLDLRVVWRVNITSPEPNHVMTSKWIPQNDLLGHEKTKLFVSHCGKNGQYEALYHGVPILCLPIYGDQFYNAERIVVKQFGLSTDMRAVSPDKLADLMKEIIYESRYRENIKNASRLFRDLYKVPMKEAAFWLDHVMTYGGQYMRSASQQMPLYQFLVLDVIAVIISIIVVIVLFIYFLVKACFRCCRCKNVSVKSKKE